MKKKTHPTASKSTNGKLPPKRFASLVDQLSKGKAGSKPDAIHGRKPY